jgi:hypothetical protein
MGQCYPLAGKPIRDAGGATHLERALDDRVVGRTTEPRHRPQRSGVNDAVGDGVLVEMDADHLTDHEVLVGLGAIVETQPIGRGATRALKGSWARMARSRPDGS